MGHPLNHSWNNWMDDEYIGGLKIEPGSNQLSEMIDEIVAANPEWSQLNLIEVPVKFIVINSVDDVTVATGHISRKVVDTDDTDVNVSYLSVIKSLNASLISAGITNVRFFAQDRTSNPYTVLKYGYDCTNDDSAIGDFEHARKLLLMYGDRNCLNIIVNEALSGDAFINSTSEFTFVYCQFVSSYKAGDDSTHFIAELLCNCLQAACGLFLGIASSIDRIDEEVSNGIDLNIMGDTSGDSFGLGSTSRQLARISLSYEYFKYAKVNRPYLVRDEYQAFDLITTAIYDHEYLHFNPVFIDSNGFIGFPEEYIVYASNDGLDRVEIGRIPVTADASRVGADETIDYLCPEYSYFSVQPVRYSRYNGIEVVNESTWATFTLEDINHDLDAEFLADLT